MIFYLRAFILFLFFTSVFSVSFSQNPVGKLHISEIKISGNEKTKSFVILRELSFKKGDTASISNLTELFNESKINLLKTPLFNSVNFDFYTSDSINAVIEIKVEERWYFWPRADIYYVDRNFSSWLKEMDLSRTDLGLGIEKYNFRGRNEKLSFYAVFGYDEELLLRYENFYFDKKRKHSGAVYLKRLKRKETGCIVENDELKRIKLYENYALKSYNVSFKYSLRQNIHNFHSVYAGYEYREVSDSLLLCNPAYFTVAGNDIDYFYLKYIFLSDKRDSRVFPLRGHKIKITLIKNGLNIFPDNGINSVKIKTEFSKYTPLGKKFFLADNFTMQTTAGNKNPFFLNTALGYSSDIRAYEYYVINGQSFGLSKNTLNFELLPKKIIYLKFLPWEKFNKPFVRIFLNTFVDFAYVFNNDDVYNENNDLTNTFLCGAGAGINVLTFYDWIFRFEFSAGRKVGNGFFLHFEAPF